MNPPAEMFLPGETIRDELAARGWTQADLARIMGRPIQVVNQIITGKKAITADTAKELAAAFGTSEGFWLNLENSYQLWRRQPASEEISRRAAIYARIPVKEMERRQWIRKTKDAQELEEELKRFWGVNSLDEVPSVIRVAARASGAETSLTPAQYTWCYRALRLAGGLDVARYEKAIVLGGIPKLRALMADPEESRKVPRVLAELGVRFLVIKHLPGSGIDGAALWHGDDSPIIAVSARYDRMDSFWFTVCHELAHIIEEDQLGTLDKGALDTDLIGANGAVSASTLEMEQRADRLASEMLIPKARLDSFIVRVRPYYSKTRIIQFAQTVGVHPGIVVGQLQHRHEIGYYANREMLVKVRHIVANAALTDGWGHIVAA